VTANAANLIGLTKDTLSPGSISVTVTGSVTEAVKFTRSFKYITIAVTEFAGTSNTINKFLIACRYLKSDMRIDKQIVKARKNSNIMITGELTYAGSEFFVDIQDVNYLSIYYTNMETATSPYSWSTSEPSGRLSMQTIAGTAGPDNNEPMDE
jgi:hypothetical protein